MLKYVSIKTMYNLSWLSSIPPNRTVCFLLLLIIKHIWQKYTIVSGQTRNYLPNYYSKVVLLSGPFWQATLTVRWCLLCLDGFSLLLGQHTRVSSLVTSLLSFLSLSIIILSTSGHIAQNIRSTPLISSTKEKLIGGIYKNTKRCKKMIMISL